MHPHLFSLGPLNVNTFGLLVGIALISALGLFWLLCKRTKVAQPVYNFYSIVGIASILMGLFGSWLFQVIYSAAAGSVTFTGLTFMGGVVMGSLTFILLPVFFAKPAVKSEFWRIVNLAVCSLALSLAIGRWGCFFTNCCYGIPHDTLGVNFPHNARRLLPTNLMEGVFSSILFVVMLVLVLRKNNLRYNILIYGGLYSIWRFIIEFYRFDNRWQIDGFALSPSQVQSIILFVVIGVLGYFVLFRNAKPLFNPHLESLSDFLEKNGVATTAGIPEELDSEVTTIQEEKDEHEQNENSFYTQSDIQTAAKKENEEVAHKAERFGNVCKYIFWGALGATAIFLIIAFSLLGAGSQVPMWFMFLLAHLFAMVATMFMPLSGGIIAGKFALAQDNEQTPELIYEYYTKGNSFAFRNKDTAEEEVLEETSENHHTEENKTTAPNNTEENKEDFLE